MLSCVVRRIEGLTKSLLYLSELRQQDWTMSTLKMTLLTKRHFDIHRFTDSNNKRQLSAESLSSLDTRSMRCGIGYIWRISTQTTMPSILQTRYNTQCDDNVVDFDQPLGAAHSKHWSNLFFLHFALFFGRFCCKNEKIKQKRAKLRFIL